VRVVARHSEHVGQILARELVAQAQLDDIPVAWIQPVDRIPDQLLQVRSFRLAAHAGRRGGHLSRLLEPGDDGPGPELPQAFVARDRVDQGQSLAGSRSPPSLAAAIRNASCTASAASAGSRSMEQQ
jgi:hypothetical protein